MKKLTLNLSKKYYTEIYNILINNCNADSKQLEEFVSYHIKNSMFPEWRFQGNLGFGGKYHAIFNRVSCYSEDLNQKTLKIIEKTNLELLNCYKKYY